MIALILVACAAGYLVNTALGAADPWLVEPRRVKPRREKP